MASFVQFVLSASFDGFNTIKHVLNTSADLHRAESRPHAGGPGGVRAAGRHWEVQRNQYNHSHRKREL